MTDQIYKCNMKKLLFAVTLSTFSVAVMGQQVYELTAPAKEKVIYSGHLKLGGQKPFRRQYRCE